MLKTIRSFQLLSHFVKLKHSLSGSRSSTTALGADQGWGFLGDDWSERSVTPWGKANVTLKNKRVWYFGFRFGNHHLFPKLKVGFEPSFGMISHHLFFFPVWSSLPQLFFLPRIAAAFGGILSSVRGCLGKLSSSRPPEPAAEVVELLQDMKITPRLVMLGGRAKNFCFNGCTKTS